MSAPDENGWFDILTAPKDGTRIIVYAALQLTLRALELEQITNSLSSTPPAMTKPNAVPSTALGTPSMQEPQ
jgi:hypothetical protein